MHILLEKIPLLKKRLQDKLDGYNDDLFTDAVEMLKHCFIFNQLDDNIALRQLSYLLIERIYKFNEQVLRQ